jgi:hypothetical protein
VARQGPDIPCEIYRLDNLMKLRRNEGASQDKAASSTASGLRGPPETPGGPPAPGTAYSLTESTVFFTDWKDFSSRAFSSPSSSTVMTFSTPPAPICTGAPKK